MHRLPPALNPADAGWQRQDMISRGLGVAAKAIGLTTDVYRPKGAACPLIGANRLLRLHASFAGPEAEFKRPPGYGDAIWYGLFDYAYTLPGDYLRQTDATWFIAAQPRLMPALCVRADRMVSFTRPITTRTIGIAAYSGVELPGSETLLRDWPASVIGAHGAMRTEARLPDDGGRPEWVVLLPAVPRVVLAPGDLMVDDLGRHGVVVAAELSDLGWRLSVHQAVP